MILTITPLYVGIFALLFLPFTFYVGMYRAKSGIFLGHDNDEEMLRRMRAQANFVETVPLALILLITMEFSGAGSTLLHSLGSVLAVGRITHYLQLSGILKPLILRGGGMLLTTGVYLVGSLWLLSNILFG